jgi:aspartyl-tRNA synthetase
MNIYKHLSSQKLIDILKYKSDLLFLIRNYFHESNFYEISTPLLSFPTKEYGDGSFIVSSKLNPGEFYSLPHSPQLYKQCIIATIGESIKKYYQIAHNFRPEIGDSYHSQEFQQIDFEIHDPKIEDIIEIIKEVVNLAFSTKGITPVFINMNYDEAISKYGSDSPDLRFSKAELQYNNDSVLFELNVNSVIDTDRLSDVLKQFSEIECKNESTKYKFVVSKNKRSQLGLLRNELIKEKILKNDTEWSFIFLTKLPLFIKSNGKTTTFHHPQSKPSKDIKTNFDEMSDDDLLSLKTDSCDLIINGLEVAGGNVRIHDHDLQKAILTFIGNTQEELETTHQPILSILKKFPEYKSGGAAIGVERIVLLLTSSKSLSEVTAFPMTSSGKEYFGGPFKLTEEEYVDIGIQSVPDIIIESRKSAISIVTENNNYIHEKNHIINVESNILKLVEKKSLSPNESLSLILSAHWHDVGKNDHQSIEEIPHEKKSINLFQNWARKNDLPKEITKTTCAIIDSHRNRSAKREIDNFLSGILWDADKLDIINVERCIGIMNNYEQRNFFDTEFNYLDTISFWKSIDENFEKKFHTKKAVKMFNQNYPAFKTYVQKVYEKYIVKSKKIIGIGGSEPISDTQKKLEKLILNSVEGKNFCYIPIATFNNRELIEKTDEYVQKVKKHYKSLDKKINFVSVSINDNANDIVDKISNSNIIYISGGDTEFLIKKLKDKEIREALKKAYEMGKYIIGNSAGILALLSDSVSIDDNNVARIYNGIGLLDDYIVIVHYDNSKKILAEKFRDEFPEKELIILKESEAVLFLDKKRIFYNYDLLYDNDKLTNYF